ncbi:hypothetical protein ACLKA6_014413 [Drosophila palustris]
MRICQIKQLKLPPKSDSVSPKICRQLTADMRGMQQQQRPAAWTAAWKMRKYENEIKYHKQKWKEVRRLVEDIATEATLIKKLFDKKSARHLSALTTSSSSSSWSWS